MSKPLIFFFILLKTSFLAAKCSEVSESIRQSYASNFYQAFLLQANGKSTSAFCQFQSACETAKKAGESIERLIVIEQLFGWYRTYGSALKLFYKKPIGSDRIIGEYQPKILKKLGRYSEWGNDPEQAGTIREFMLGVAEVISGTFCVTVSSGVAGGVGVSVAIDGGRRIILTLNKLWVEHQKAILDLKKWEETIPKDGTSK